MREQLSPSTTDSIINSLLLLVTVLLFIFYFLLLTPWKPKETFPPYCTMDMMGNKDILLLCDGPAWATVACNNCQYYTTVLYIYI